MRQKLIYILIIAWIVSHFSWLGIVGTSSDLARIGNSLFTTGGAILSSAMLLLAIYKHPTRSFTQRLFFLLLLGNIALIAGEVGQLVLQIQRAERFGPFDWIDFVFSLQIIFYLIAFCYFLFNRRTQINLRFFLFDELIILIVAGSISWHYMITPYLENATGFDLETLLLIRYPLGDLLLLGGMIILFFGVMKRGNSKSLLLVLLGFHLQLLADLLYVVLYRADFPVSAMWLDPVWLATTLTVGGAAILFDADERSLDFMLNRRVLDWVRLVTPYIFLLILFITMARQAVTFNGLTIGLMIATPLLISRQIRIVMDNQRLRENLEAKVDQRTADLERALEEMEHMAYHDALTNLPNRYLFARLFKEELRRAEIHERLAALYFIDVDHFKQINDTYGHQIGDQLIIDIASRLEKKLPHNTVISRQGGDEFVVLLFDVKETNVIEECGQVLVQLFERPFILQETPVFMTASIGCAIYPTHATSRTTLIEQADVAMYEAKRRGKNQFYLQAD
ncbi:GGDEF domain-containing protein [Exiguobacterium oxidotolerans]|uniref:GGDEF domain-containing protein n=1 Tax=Exiguobacterium oxidotolerans TaxID=223958 RepID=A0A653I4N8_9BACL|nr:GGDEF domain-containing protein [Exiguobacterium oxidotolerans]VWX33790.1 GGDEF domain-containing protein [Exiguobacterium oxidotolerans]